MKRIRDKEKQKIWRKNYENSDPARYKQKKKQWEENYKKGNVDKYRSMSAARCRKHYQAIKNDPDRLKLFRQKKADKMRRRRQSRVECRVKNNLISRLSSLVSGEAKSSSTFDLLGCSIGRFMDYMSCHFKTGMSWSNYGEWHIDHVIACAKFDLTDIAQQKLCFHFTNLQPLWAADNLSKGAR